MAALAQSAGAEVVARAICPDDLARLTALSGDLLAAADLVVVLVDHAEFKPATIAQYAPLVFDTKGIMRGQEFAGELL